MNADNTVLLFKNLYRFATPERAAEARDWIAARGALLNPPEFALKFPDAVLQPGPPGGGTFAG